MLEWFKRWGGWLAGLAVAVVAFVLGRRSRATPPTLKRDPMADVHLAAAEREALEHHIARDIERERERDGIMSRAETAQEEARKRVQNMGPREVSREFARRQAAFLAKRGGPASMGFLLIVLAAPVVGAQAPAEVKHPETGETGWWLHPEYGRHLLALEAAEHDQVVELLQCRAQRAEGEGRRQRIEDLKAAHAAEREALQTVVIGERAARVEAERRASRLDGGRVWKVTLAVVGIVAAAVGGGLAF